MIKAMLKHFGDVYAKKHQAVGEITVNHEFLK